MLFHYNNETPIYLQLAEHIRDAILSGAFPEGGQIPSTTEISVSDKINPATALKGVTLLVEEGILYKKRGLGMFVSEGAAEMIAAKKKEKFFEDYIIRLVDAARKLKLSSQDIVAMIERGFSA